MYDPATGLLKYDEDGSGPIAAIQVAKLPLGLDVTAADFFVMAV